MRKQKEVEIGRKTHAQAVRNVNIKGVGFSRIYVNWLKMKKVIPLKQKLSLLHWVLNLHTLTITLKEKDTT